ncbi:c-type cytochrome [Endozoicomonas elysicola]|uniref:Cytochrome C n=1 Tax=Endozoicomonas elysicola TaxID=305900 RepID=A0A081KBG0_9GAMM|nr:c-type cytochrome [Endozoicomonas elysicola]KEI71486.1 cytochrome C [Endozoicomonas elysicola]
MKFLKTAKYLTGTVLFSFLLTACDSSQILSSKEAFDPTLASQLQPEDSHLSAIYNRSCKACHTIANTGAPLTGDSYSWDSRMDKGMDELLDNVINGFGGMPPFGMCMDCDPEQFEALITFMAAPAE